MYIFMMFELKKKLLLGHAIFNESSKKLATSDD